MGFTVVDVNMRGTGCSGGAYDFFEPLQSLDGYDVVETIARQPWVLHHKVGMMGISYGGISQLFTAQLNPPQPGGDLADVGDRQHPDDAVPGRGPQHGLRRRLGPGARRTTRCRPSADGGQAWAQQRIQDGDATCRDNQALHPEAIDLMDKIRANAHYVPEVADPLAPVTFVDRIHVPVYMACQWTDEQTGGHCPALAEHMTGTQRKWFTFTNGTHIDALDPQTFNRWYDFLQLYVAQQAPLANAAVIRAAAPAIYQEAMGITGVTLPRDPIQEQLTYHGALTAFESLKPIRVLFDNGAGGPQAGYPNPGYEHSFDAFPIPGTTARSWYLNRDGALADAAPAVSGSDRFTWNATARPFTDFAGDTAGGAGGLWTATPTYDWRQSPAGNAVSYLSAPLKQDTTVIGAGALEAWVRTGRPNVDLQATITEVRPDGKETFVQSGWLRAERAQARPRPEHAAGAGPEPARVRRGADARRSVRAGDDPALLPGPRLPGRVAAADHHQRAQRRSADLGVRRDRPAGHGDGRRRARPRDAVASAAARRARPERAHRPAALPGAARRAVPRLPAGGLVTQHALRRRAPAPASAPRWWR